MSRLFSSLSQDGAIALRAASSQHRLNPGSTIPTQDGAEQPLGLVIQGRLTLRGTGRWANDLTVGTLEPGDFYGGIPWPSSTLPSIELVAVEPTEVLEWASESLQTWRCSFPEDACTLQTQISRCQAEGQGHTTRLALTLFRVGSLMSAADSLDVLTGPVLDTLRDALPSANATLIWLVNSDRGELVLSGLSHTHARPDPLEKMADALPRTGAPLSLGDPLSLILERTDEGVLLETIPSESALQTYVTGNPKVVAAPLRSRAKLEGFLMALSWLEDARPSGKEVGLLAAVAAQVGGALERLKGAEDQRGWLVISGG